MNVYQQLIRKIKSQQNSIFMKNELYYHNEPSIIFKKMF